MVKSPKLSMTILFWILKYKKMLLKWQIMLLPLILLMYFGMETKKYKASLILKSKIYLIVYFYLKYYFVLSCSCILFSAICFFYSLHFFIWSIYLSFIFLTGGGWPGTNDDVMKALEILEGVLGKADSEKHKVDIFSSP